MSFGSLHILQHKSWHVYSEKNRERVKQDEEAARLEEEAKQKRIETAESEHRLSVLRARAKQLVSTEDDEGTVAVQDTDSTASRVLEEKSTEDAESSVVVVRAKDVFGNEVDNNFVVRTNPEREAEEKLKKERVDRRQNVYLDQSEKERRRWYTMPKKETVNTEGEEPGLVFKRRADPLSAIQNALKQQEKRAGTAVDKRTKRYISGDRKSSASIPSGTESSVDLLQKEREERERQERRKLQILLNPGLLEPIQPHLLPHAFSSQYNPTLTHEAHIGRPVHFETPHDHLREKGNRKQRRYEDDDRREPRSRSRTSPHHTRSERESERNQRKQRFRGENDGIDERTTSRDRDDYRSQKRHRSRSRNRDRSRGAKVNGRHDERRRRDRS